MVEDRRAVVRPLGMGAAKVVREACMLQFVTQMRFSNRIIAFCRNSHDA